MECARKWLAVAVGIGVVAAIGFTPGVAQAEATAGSASAGIAALLGLPDQGGPQQTDTQTLPGLQSVDPSSQISLIDPPTANNQGAARLSYPIEVPAGRADSQPKLSIAYDSSAANGWLGLGWDLSSEAISVDTRWGVPRYDPDNESESYDFSGNELTPLAHTGDLQPRQKNREFKERIEGTFYTIIRWGDSPADYWWEVIDQSATAYYFGAKLTYVKDAHGDPVLTPTLDEDQVLRDAKGNIFKWPLTVMHDFSGNVTTYQYTRVDDPVSAKADLAGTQLYLSKITYDGFDSGEAIEPGPYTVTLALTPYVSGTTPRPDAITDARGGFLQVTARLLSTVTVAYDGTTIRSYKLAYQPGEFHKTLLRSIAEYGADGTKFNTHTFAYYDTVKPDGDTAGYNGFTKNATTWDTGSDSGVAGADISGLENPSSLSGGYSNSYDGHIYLGFNPLEPSKDGSVGATLDVNHIDSDESLALLDINGDGLPDKVFERGSGVYYRLNRSGPDGGYTFGEAHEVQGLNTLGTQSADSVTVGPEAHIAASLAYGHTWTVNTSRVYFIDVNNDALPDLVHGTSVLFNHLVKADDGTMTPAFSADSAPTRVPIGESHVDAKALLPELTEIYQQELKASPLVDAVRRWVAPYSGTIAITGSAGMADPAPSSYDTADGVTVAIQHNGAQLWSQHVGARATDGVTPPEGKVGAIDVKAGDRIYFRVESGYDGKYDAVAWNPTITYTDRAAGTDVNGLPTTVFTAADDFTTAGRPDMRITMPFTGTIGLSGALHKTAPTSDDVTLQVLDVGMVGAAAHTPKVLFTRTLRADQIGTITPPDDLDVAKGQVLELKVAVDSRIDLARIRWAPQLYYTAGTAADGEPLVTTDQSGKHVIQLNPPYSTDVYARSTMASPQTGVARDKGAYVIVPSTPATVPATPGQAGATGDPVPMAGHPTGTIVFTAKTAHRLLAKETLTVTKGLVTACSIEKTTDASTSACDLNATGGWPSVTIDLDTDARVFYAFSTVDPVLSDDITSGAAGGDAVPVYGAYNTADSAQNVITGKGLYAQPYRGWASTSYNGGNRSDADAAMDESKLIIDTSDYPSPDDYYHPDLGSDGEHSNNTNTHPYPTNDTAFDPTKGGFVGAADSPNPINADAWPLAPSPAHRDESTQPAADLPDQWAGSKNESWTRAGTMSSTRLGQDYVQVPSADDFATAGAVWQVSLSQQDAIEADLFGIGGSYSWGYSDGLLDELDMNGDGFPDIVSGGNVQYTDQVGRLDSSAASVLGAGAAGGIPGLPGSNSVRETHSSAWSLGLSGDLARFGADAKGSTNAPQQAQPGSGIVKKAGSASSGAHAADEGTAKRNAAGALPGSAGGAAESGGAAGEESDSEGSGGSSAVSKRGSGSSGASGNDAEGGAPLSASDIASKLNLGVSGKYGQGTSNHDDDHEPGFPLVDTDLIDINGDGLPDRVSTDDNGHMKVAFNLGYAFTDAVSWSDDAVVQKGSSASVTGGATLGFNDGMFGISGGVAGGTEADQDDGVLVDMNGDGLVDYATDKDGELLVAVNTGDGFAAPVVWQHAMTSAPIDGVDSQVATSTSVDLGGGGYFTVGIPTCFIPPDFEPACYIIINPGFDYSRSMTRQELQLRDVNGDGYPDNLASTSESKLDVKLNQTGTTNLLKTVDRPLGASFDIEYARTGNTTDDPSSTWAMSKVTVHADTPAPSVDTQVTTYAYDHNVYDQFEREGYGFATVTSSQLGADGQAYRSVVQRYANDSYYDQGLLTRQTLVDASGAKQTQTVNDYTLYDVDTGKDLTAVQARANSADAVFPKLSTTTEEYYQGRAAPGKTTSADYVYDAHGNPTRIIDHGDGPQNTVIADITYADCPAADPNDPGADDDATNVFNVPTEVKVTGADGDILRDEHSIVKCSDGAPSKIAQSLADGTSAVTTIAYDEHFNIASITNPAGAGGKAYKVTYEYDPQTSTYPSMVTDSFGYRSTATYDPRFGAVASSTDLNGNTTDYRYDEFGRIIAVVGPNQQGSGADTLSFEYAPDAAVPWAQSHAIDTLYGGTLDTVTFVDGLDRTVQTTHDATVATAAAEAPKHVVVASGRVVFDAFGRTVKQYYPTAAPLGAEVAFHADFDAVDPAVSTYDVLDRLTKYVAPSHATTTWAYDFGDDRAGDTEFRSIRTDARQNTTATYTDVRRNVRAVAMHNGGDDVWTQYAYNPLGQLTATIDDHGNTTSIAYDRLGRETSITSPDSGRTDYGYDLASNMISQQTADLRAAKGSPQITYGYDYTHLTSIHYPGAPETDVAYTYGDPGAAHNGAGRVVAVTDQAGRQTYEYDKIGDVTRESDTINAIHAQPHQTYVTSFGYDTWGRQHTLTYPDGEKLTYSYGFGGLVDAAAGAVDGRTQVYVSGLQYDKFGHQVLQQNGNGTATRYGYGATTQRLVTIASTGASGVFQNQSYAYDAVGNVTAERNDVPAPTAGEYGGPSSQTFTYDDLYRLTSATGTYRYAPKNTRTYALRLTYDSLGDILTNTQTDTITVPGGASQVQAATTHDWRYAYQGMQPNAVSAVTGTGTLSGVSNGKGSGNTPSMGAAFSYDPNGNQTGWQASKGGERRSIVWDDANRIQSIANNGQTTRFRYDANGNRVVTYGPGGVTTTVNRYYTVINADRIVKNVFVGTQRVAQHSYTTDEPDSDAVYWYQRDLQGSTAYVTDQGGTVFQHLEYFPTGAPWVDEVSDPHVIDYLYASQAYSPVTQLSYFGARYLDPVLGQFLSPDPAMQPSPQAAVDDPMRLQPYSFADDNPVRNVDPDGRAPTSAQQEYLHRAFSTPEGRQAFMTGTDRVVKAWLGTQPRHVRWAVNAATNKSKLIGAYKKFAAPDVPPLIGVTLHKGGKIKVKIIGISIGRR